MKTAEANEYHKIIELVILTTATVFEVDWKDITNTEKVRMYSLPVRQCKQFSAYMLSRYMPKEYLQDIFKLKESGVYDLVRWGKLLAFNHNGFASVRRLIIQKQLKPLYLKRA